MQIAPGVLRMWDCRKGDIPAVAHSLNDFGSVKVVAESFVPDFDRKGRGYERFTQAVHVRSDTKSIKTTRDTADILLFDLWAGTEWLIMARTGFGWFGVVVGVVELGPENLIDKLLLEVLVMICKSRIAHEIEIGDGVIKIERGTWCEEERDELASKRIKRSTRPGLRCSIL